MSTLLSNNGDFVTVRRESVPISGSCVAAEVSERSDTDYAMYAVANRELLDLALSGQR